MYEDIPAPKLSRCASALKTLAHPQRLRLLSRLEQGPATVSELTEYLKLPQPEVSTHLARLREKRLVEGVRDGRFVRYQIANSACFAILECIRKHFHTQS